MKGFESIRTTLVFAFSALTVGIMILVSAITYNYTVQDFRRLSLRNTSTLLGEINASIDSYIANMKSMGALIAENGDVRAWLESPDTAGSGSAAGPDAEKLLAIVQGTRDDVTNVAVIRDSDRAVLFGDPESTANPYAASGMDWYDMAVRQSADVIVYPSHVQNLVNGRYTWVISIARALLRDDGKLLGVMVIDLNYRTITDMCERGKLGKSGYVFIVDQDGRVIYHPQQQLLYSGLKSEPVAEILALDNGENYIDASTSVCYTADFSSVTGWTTVGAVSGDELVDTYAIVRYHMLVALAMMPLAVGAALLISMAVTRPIQKLESSMRRVENGDLTVRSDIKLSNEIGRLSDEFNAMVERTGALMEQVRSDEEQKRKNEFKALQAQINPHFLYNTLDSIIWMAAGGRNDEVVEMASALAKLFRTSISRGDAYPTVASEVENIRSYLTIQKMRYRDKLDYSIDVPPELLQCRMPGLILQPLVENAIYHGIKPKPDGGKISVGGARGEDELTLWVIDDGVGMSAEKLAFIREDKSGTKRGIGVANVNSRIQLSYGEKYGLTYESEPDRGTRVTVRLPLLNEEGV